ncbi:TIGR01459 family HAD-type hydrolase [Falsirhodobacter halotolerans]|uniref:TIGR01459 family HAD-type hydrolase n=1 Tax=Falsirhodobacter halotolerans TaxID=1146892 RepID=UPI001FD49F6D|nr:TIGR01459 family HAD-type hydrolase [Falsirhodobacter halotolerans]MCJ8138733.1 TIGR01459 family HAD-type hydrolase [Falsirhodobacter halotolerans]
MARIVQSLADLGQYRALFCDIWGCLHDGVAPFPDAVTALQTFRRAGGTVILVTNSPRPKRSVVEQIDAMGVPRDAWDDVATSGDAAQFAMLTGAVGRRVHHVGAPKDEGFFSDLSADLSALAAQQPAVERVPLKEAEGIVCTGLFDDLTDTLADYDGLLADAKARDLPLLCANPDIEVDIGHQRVLCAGAIAQAYDRIGGRSIYLGKPHRPIYDLARRKRATIAPDLTDADTLCVGDGILTDVQGGVSEGIDSLFITSGLAAKHFGDDTANPDATLLEKWLIEQTLEPTFAIGHLR